MSNHSCDRYLCTERDLRVRQGDERIRTGRKGDTHNEVNYWYRGKLNPDLGLNEGLLFYSYDDCQPNTARMRGACSLKKLRPEKTFMNEWWVKIRYQGKEGWVLNTGQFDNVDACG
jgi:hypothetical protein